MRVLLYEHTRPELSIPVIRAMAPGLRHFWARFAPGRLYDVPVRLGRLAKPQKESELNPVPYFL
jgi:ribosomal protein S12 methylthiotransferase accessory factor